MVPVVDPMKTTEEPAPRCGTAAFVSMSGAATLVRHCCSIDSSEVSASTWGSKRLAVWTIPWREPNAPTARSGRPAVASMSSRSTAAISARPPAAPVARACSPSRFTSRPTSSTEAPAAPSARAVDAPMPELAPVTITALPLRPQSTLAASTEPPIGGRLRAARGEHAADVKQCFPRCQEHVNTGVAAGQPAAGSGLDRLVRLGDPVAAQPGAVCAVRAPQDVVPRLDREATDAGDVDTHECAVPLHDLAVDEHGVHEPRMRVVDDGADRVVERRHAEVVCADEDDVGALAGRQRADLAVHPHGARALDRRELEHVAAGQLELPQRTARRGLVEAALRADRGPDRAEEVAAVGAAHVDREARAHPRVEQATRGGPAVAHLQLDVRRDRGRAAGVRHHLELV